MKTGIIILNWNGKEDTLKCLASLDGVEAEVLVVDNGSTDGSEEAIKKSFPQHAFIQTGKNLGYAGGNNVGIDYGLKNGWEAFIILNNDTTVDSAFARHFIRYGKENPQAGILGAKIYRMDDPERFDHLGGKWDPKQISFSLIAQDELDVMGKWEEAIPLDYVCGACLFIKREVIEKVGPFEARFFLFWEESDLCYRARKAGFEVRLCPEAKIWHKGSASFIGGKPHTSYFYHRGRLLWLERNLNPQEREPLLAQLKEEERRLKKRYALKKTQLLLAPLLHPEMARRRKHYARQLKAALAGMRDFSRGQFGPGPAWLTKR